MKKIFLISIAIVIALFAGAQNKKNTNYNKKFDKAPLYHKDIKNSYNHINKVTDFDKSSIKERKQTILKKSANNLWNVQFSYNVDKGSGIETNGNNFYVSQWNKNIIYVYNLTGNLIDSFSVSLVAGIRDMAWDGTYFYGSDASNVIYKMNFTTHTLVDSIVCPSNIVVRHIAYDNTNDAFWVGDWDTDIFLVNRTGAIINTIQSSTHMLSGMYGSAYDNITQGGPYLWVFDQGGNGCNIVMIKIATGSQTGVIHDCTSDVASDIYTPAAGGLFIHTNLFAGTTTLGGIIQQDKIFGYNLSTLVVQKDVGVEEFISPVLSSGCSLGSNENIKVKIRNYGLSSVSSFTVHLKFNNNNYTSIVSNTINSFDTLTVSFSGTFNFSAPAVYKMTAYTAYPADTNYTNDTLYNSIITGNGICQVNVLTDDYPEETSWYIYNLFNYEIYGTSGYMEPNTLYSTDVCVDTTLCYTYAIFDDYGDGIMSPGYYEVLFNSNPVAYNDTFSTDYEEVTYVGSCDYSDIGVVNVLSPISSCSLSDEEFVTVSIKNFGTQTVYNPEVTYIVNGVTVIEQVFDSLESQQEIDYTFINLCDLSALNLYNLKAYTTYTGDANNFNDTILYDFENYSPATLPYIISFDDTTVNAQIIVEDENEDYYTWALLKNGGINNSNCAFYSFNPNEPANDWFFTKCIDLTTGTQYLLKFYYKAESGIFPEKLKVHLCQDPSSSSASSNPLIDLNNITDSVYTMASVPFTVSSDENYYLGWNVYSEANKWNLYVDSITVAVSASIEENINNNSVVIIYPNPANQYLYLNTKDYSEEITFTDVIGKTHLIFHNTKPFSKIDVSSLAKGVYFVKIKSDNKTIIRKLIIN